MVSCSPQPLTNHSYSFNPLEGIKTISYLAPKRPLQKLCPIPAPKIAFPLFSTKTLKSKIKLSLSVYQPKICVLYWSSLPFEDLFRDRPGETPLLPRSASYEAKWFDVALSFAFLSLRPISSANILATILGNEQMVFLLMSFVLQLQTEPEVMLGSLQNSFALHQWKQINAALVNLRSSL